MQYLRCVSCLLALSLFAALSACSSAPPAPVQPHVYLVVKDDPATSIVVQYHTPAQAESMVEYGTAAPAEGAPYEFKATGSARQIPNLPDARYIHAVELKGLKPGTTYHFKTASGQTGKFRTLAGGTAPVRVLFGGDIGTEPLAVKFLQEAAKHEPDIAMLGGDIAYDDGSLKKIDLWRDWFNNWQTIMVRKDGTMIPMILAIGNHEMNNSGSPDPAIATPTYTGFFEQGGGGHFVRDISPLARIVVLDSDYQSSEEEQVPFLREALSSAADRPYLIADYHVSLFPTNNSYDQDHPTAGRKHWVPLFDEFDLTVAFEHHDHAFKRSKPMRGGKVDPEGTVYLGDGGMGQEVREAKNAGAWYFEKAEGRSHFWIADITAESMHCKAIDENGVVFDETTFSPRAAAVAAP